MATIDAASVKRLREATNAGIMDCKSALQEAGGDFDRAVTLLREKGIASAGKKADRATSEGAIGLYVSVDGKTGALVEVNCETDFVARNEQFVTLANALAEHAAQGNATEPSALLAQNGGAAEQAVKEAIGTLGENIRVGRVAKIETDGFVASYIHHDRKQAALVEVTGTDKSQAEELGRDLATQVVAMRPEYVNRTEIPEDRLNAERAIYAQQAAAEGKPEAIQQKIAEGRLNKEFFGAVTLLDQPFIKEQKQSVGQYIKQTLGGATVARFVRFRVGEGS